MDVYIPECREEAGCHQNDGAAMGSFVRPVTYFCLGTLALTKGPKTEVEVAELKMWKFCLGVNEVGQD